MSVLKDIFIDHYGNAEDLLQFAPPEQVLAGVCERSASVASPGVIDEADNQGALTHVGTLVDDMTKAECIVKMFQECGIPAVAHTKQELQEMIWHKLVINAAENATSAVLRVRTLYIINNDYAGKMWRMLLKEAVQVANACGVPFDEKETEDCHRKRTCLFYVGHGYRQCFMSYHIVPSASRPGRQGGASQP